MDKGLYDNLYLQSEYGLSITFIIWFLFFIVFTILIIRDFQTNPSHEHKGALPGFILVIISLICLLNIADTNLPPKSCWQVNDSKYLALDKQLLVYNESSLRKTPLVEFDFSKYHKRECSKKEIQILKAYKEDKASVLHSIKEWKDTPEGIQAKKESEEAIDLMLSL